MPSLNALGQFKSSFNSIANEKEDIQSLKLPFDDLKLPRNEAPPFNYVRNISSSVDTEWDSSLITSDPGLNTSPQASGTDDFDFNAFLNDLPVEPSSSIDAQPGGALSILDDILKDIVPSSSASSSAASHQPDPDTFSQEDDSSFLDDLPGAQDDPFGMNSDNKVFADEGSVPDDLLAGFSDEMDASPADFPSDNTDTDFNDDFFSTGGLDDQLTNGFSDTPFEPDSGIEEQSLQEPDDFGIDLGGESQSGSLTSDNSGFDSNAFDPQPDSQSFGIDEDNLFSGDTANDTASIPDSSLDFNNDSIDLGGESPLFKSVKPADGSGDFSVNPQAESWSGDSLLDDFMPDTDSDFNTGFGDQPNGDFSDTFGETSGTSDSLFDFKDESSSQWSPSDNLDDFKANGSDNFNPLPDIGDLGSDFESDSITLENETHEDHSDFSGDVFSSDDFSLSGIDDILNKSKAVSLPAPVQKKGLFGKRKEKVLEEPAAEADVEEISLSQDEVDRLLQTLSAYPLNLRIICEELIAEQVILPQQLSKLIRLLVNGVHVRETAAHVESITGKPVVIPKSFEKMTGAAFEAEQASFGYIFIHNFLPVLRLFAVIILLAGSVLYLCYNFIYIPLNAESIYRRGYERIPAGEYQRANDLFQQAFAMHRSKKWFYSYAEAFIDQRRYALAEGKYDELLRYYPRDKKGILDYAALNTYYLLNYEKANRLLQRELLDYSPNDYEGLLAAGDNFLLWADSNPSRFYDRYEDARFSYARLLDRYGWQPPIVERMMKYFIRTDNLRETLSIRLWFESNQRRRLSAESLAELGGYLLDKQLERPAGVPDPYIESIESVRDMLLQAVLEEPTLPEPHYHLARYHHNLGNMYEERLTLENAIRAFNLASHESVRRRLYRVDTHYRYANLLIENREFFPAETEAVRGIELYEDFMNRNLIYPSVQLGQLYAVMGDLEYFVKTGNMRAALDNYYLKAESYGYAPPEILYRMGAAYYQLEEWRNALEYLFRASAELPLNRKLLFALGNTAYQRGDYFAAQGYYNRLLDILENQRIRLPVLLPNDSVQYLETGERLMMARNNLGVVNEALAEQTGNRDFRSRALAMYSESSRAWDAITRNPETMTRMRLTESPGAPSINLGYLNANNALRPGSGYDPQIFIRIDKDVLEPSRWEELLR